MHFLSGLALLAFGCCSLAIPQATTTQAAPPPPTQFYPFPIYPMVISTWIHMGCYTEGSRSRALDGPSLINYTFMSQDLCGSFCASFWAQQDYEYFGIENGGECYCGNSLSLGTNEIPSGGCTEPCPIQVYNYREIHVNKTCGGKEQIEIFSNHGLGPIYPSILPSAGNYSYVGCYADTTEATLGGGRMASFNMTLDTCASFCSQFTFESRAVPYQIFGLQEGTECYCGNAIEPGTELAPDSDCEEKTCSGNATEYCGGTNRLITYVLPGTYVPY